MSATGRQRLTSWKEIAAHLGRDVRTVMRWNKERGLPIRRIPGTSRRVIFAYSDELDAWAQGELHSAGPDPPGTDTLASGMFVRWSRIALGITGLCLAIAAAAAWAWRASHANQGIVAADLTATGIRAIADNGETLWTYVLPLPVSPHTTRIVDLDGDGRRDVVASMTPLPANGQSGSVLLALDSGGRKLWERKIDSTITFCEDKYGGPWLAEQLLVYRSGGQPFVAWAVRHNTWWPSMLAVFDARGERTGTFVNSGWIRSINASADGRYLLAGGFNNARHGAAVAILDARHPDGASPEEAGSAYDCRSCGTKRPLRYYVIPWSDLVDPTVTVPGTRHGEAASHADGSIQLRAVIDANVESIVELTPSFEVKSRHVNDGYWDWHLKLQKEGVLTHGRDRCPFRDGPGLLEWTRERGWRDLAR